MTGTIELAPGVRLDELRLDAKGPANHWTISHQLEDGSWCAGYVPREPSATNHRGWNTSTGSVEDGNLTLASSIHSESVKCHTHPEFHGFVRDGKWVPV